MIIVKVNKDEITIKGHSGYGTEGSDIVCASVSSICITTVNALISIDEDCVLYDSKDGYLLIKILKHSEVIDKLINNMITLLKDLEKQYNKYIEIR